MMEFDGVGITGATKIIGLSDQDKFCIYDSRVGNALRNLKKDGKKIVLCPPGRVPGRDCDHTSYRQWAINYQRLIWTLEIMRDSQKEKDPNLRIVDIEMALFMMGK